MQRAVTLDYKDEVFMCRNLGVGRWIAILAFLVMGVCPLVASAGFLTTADNVTIQAGGSGQVTVRWTSTQSLNYLTTGFVLQKISGDDQAVSYIADINGKPAMPPLLETGYLFAGNSFAASLLPDNPASVSQTNYAADTYIMADATSDSSDYAQDGTRVWTVLNLMAGANKSGVYRLVFQSSAYDFAASGGTAVGLNASDLDGGIITIQNTSVVPEPSGFVLGLTGCMAMFWRLRKRGFAKRC
jgi:hypothetical protein